MTPPSNQGVQGHREDRQTGVDEVVAVGEGQHNVKDSMSKLSMGQKLLLVAEFLGLEGSLTYEQLYLIPILQTLGMPLSLASLVGLVSGPLGAVLVPALGCLSDKGKNPNRRKKLGVLLSTALMIIGLGLVIVASCLYLQSQDSRSSVATDTTPVPSTSLNPERRSVGNDNNIYEISNTSKDSHFDFEKGIFELKSVYKRDTPVDVTPLKQTDEKRSSSFVSVTENSTVEGGHTEYFDTKASAENSLSGGSTGDAKSQGSMAPTIEHLIKALNLLNLGDEADPLPLAPTSEIPGSKLGTANAETTTSSISETSLNVTHDRPVQYSSLSNENSSGAAISTTAAAVSVANHENSEEVTFTAGLAMFGFIVFEVGYDQTSAVVRAWMLVCSPATEHTSLLVLALVMAGVGMIVTSALGRVNFSSWLNWTSNGGVGNPGLIVQTTIQGAVTVVLIVFGMLSTLITGQRLLRKNHKVNDVTDNNTANTDSDLTAKISSKEAPALTNDGSRATTSCCSDEEMPEAETEFSEKEIEAVSNEQFVTSGNGGHLDPAEAVHKPDREGAANGRESSNENHTTHRSRRRSCTELFACCSDPVTRRFCCKLFAICVGMFFSCGAHDMFTYMISDYVGKAVYGGDPGAERGSDGLQNYMAGVRTTAWGMLLYSVSYLLINLVHTRILNLLGHKVEFVLMQLLLGSCMVAQALTARLEVFFLLSVVAGLHRACLYVVAFAAANDVIQAQSSEHGGAKAGFAMSVVAAMIPLSITTLFPWVGPLTEWTGAVATPLWIGVVFSCLAACGFLFV